MSKIKKNIGKDEQKLAPVEQWISNEELQGIYSSAYWNDIEEEKKKKVWITGDEEGEDKLLNYLHTSGLLKEYREAENIIMKAGYKKIVIADLAAGSGWTSAFLSKLPDVKKVYAVEISKHRIGEMFKRTCETLEGRQEKISRYIGSFYDLKFDDSSIDVVFMSQAFHHANKPYDVLQEIRRVLKKNGLAILTGEHNINTTKIIKRFFSILIKKRKFITKFYDLFPADSKLGDHYYRHDDYVFLGNSLGFQVICKRCKDKNIYNLIKK